ncbi:MAG: penicillin acylase family protein [Gemmatimonadales bacterium]
MRAPKLQLFVSAVILGALLVLGFRGAGPLPPLGPLLDPANGAWALARGAEFPRQAEAPIPGLTGPVQVLYDDRGVPHIFAANELDAWRAQGYVLARDRLFQLELQTRAAAGTLAELVGPRALPADLADRRRGFPWAAERAYGSLDSTSQFRLAALAYADGVNAFIGGLNRAALPLEYRLLNARPARWEPINSYYLFLQMAYTLAWVDPALTRLEAQVLVGREAADALFPITSPIQEPIQPNGQSAPRYDLTPVPPPGPPDSTALVALRQQRSVETFLGRESEWSSAELPSRPAAQPSSRRGSEPLGSNNWAVAPQRTAAGYALLAGDPHLDLSLPSIWYEIHLNVAGGPDVAGVTFAGSPGVIIGWNRDVAWSFTNTGADVRDLYREGVDDSIRPTRYRLDGEWKPLEVREESVRDREGRVLAIDTVRFTHRGPLVEVLGHWRSIRWTPFEAKSTGEEFLRLARARDHVEWLHGWKDFVGPAQNGIVADRTGTIAIRSTGRFPVRPDSGRGDLIRDGSTRASDWIGYLPIERYPFAENPPQGYLASANQQPVDPRVNGAYLGANWYSGWRALRLNQLLRADSALTPDAIRRMQTDHHSARVDRFVPFLVAAGASPSAPPEARSAAQLLESWHRRYARADTAALLFEAVMDELEPLVWDELVPPRDPRADTARGLGRPAVVPEEGVLLRLLADSTSAWWDRRETGPRERRDAVLAEALRRGWNRTVERYGRPGEGWRWDRVHHTNIWHLLRMPALSALALKADAGPGTLNPSPGSGIHGASWRMVVELGPAVRAWTIYPGGQSGNPASARYDDRIPRWLAGDLDSALFPARAEELPAHRVRARLTLLPAR